MEEENIPDATSQLPGSSANTHSTICIRIQAGHQLEEFRGIFHEGPEFPGVHFGSPSRTAPITVPILVNSGIHGELTMERIRAKQLLHCCRLNCSPAHQACISESSVSAVPSAAFTVEQRAGAHMNAAPGFLCRQGES